MSYPPPPGDQSLYQPPAGFPPPANAELFGQPPTGFPPPAMGAPGPPRKSKAGVVILAVVLPAVLLLLVCGGVGGVWGYSEYRKEQRSKALATLTRTLGTPVGYSTTRRDSAEETLNAVFTMYCTTASKCANDNPVKHAFTWLTATGFSAAASEEDVALCFKKSCTLHATKTTDAGKVELSASLRTEMENRKFRIHIQGGMPS